jgi:hypothetical protein
MTSANVTEYSIIKKSTGEVVGNHRQHHYCKTNWESLALKYNPIEDYSIQPYGYDEEDEYWEGEVHDLYDFLVEVGFIELT